MNEKVEYLERYIKTSKRIKVINTNIEELRMNMMPSGIRYDKDKVQTSPSDPMIEYAEQLDKLERLLKEKSIELNKVLSQIEESIKTVDDDELAAVLEAKYIFGKTYKQIGHVMGYSRATVVRKHWNAIENLKIFKS